MSNPVAVCNSALITLGANTISTLSDTSIEGKACNTKWAIARRDTIRSHPWNFAVKRVVIAPEVTVPVYGYQYQFILPADALRLLEVYDTPEYKVEGRKILTNNIRMSGSPGIEIKYISDIEDVAEWDASFVNVMVYRMAMELAYTLPGKNTMVQDMTALYGQFAEQAKAIDAQEDVEDQLDPFLTPLIAVRR